MAIQYRGEITGFELSPEIDGNSVIVLQITIPKLGMDMELGDEGTLKFLEHKYPFINRSNAISIARTQKIHCLVEKDGDQFKYVAYLTVNSGLIPTRD